jgi:hypothetical protein
MASWISNAQFHAYHLGEGAPRWSEPGHGGGGFDAWGSGSISRAVVSPAEARGEVSSSSGGWRLEWPATTWHGVKEGSDASGMEEGGGHGFTLDLSVRVERGRVQGIRSFIYDG